MSTKKSTQELLTEMHFLQVEYKYLTQTPFLSRDNSYGDQLFIEFGEICKLISLKENIPEGWKLINYDEATKNWRKWLLGKKDEFSIKEQMERLLANGNEHKLYSWCNQTRTVVDIKKYDFVLNPEYEGENLKRLYKLIESNIMLNKYLLYPKNHYFQEN